MEKTSIQHLTLPPPRPPRLSVLLLLFLTGGFRSFRLGIIFFHLIPFVLMMVNELEYCTDS